MTDPVTKPSASSADVAQRIIDQADNGDTLDERLELIARAYLAAIAPLTSLASLPLGDEIITEHDLVLYANAGRSITVGDVLAARAAIAKDVTK